MSIEVSSNGASVLRKKMLVTPALAAEWMADNPHNRKLSKRAVLLLSEAIRRGEWIYNGQPIIICSSGCLLDGQHRLSAIICAGIPVESDVIFGMPYDAYKTIDNGGRGGRTRADVLYINQEPNAHSLASTVNLFHKFVTRQIKYPYAGSSPTTLQQEMYLKHHPKLRESVSESKRKQLKQFVPSVVAFCHYIFGEIDSKQRDCFFDDLATGAGLGEFDSVKLLRDWLLERGNSNSKAKPSQRHMLAMFFKAWEMRRSGRAMKRLTWNEREGFPDIDGEDEVAWIRWKQQTSAQTSAEDDESLL